MSQTNDPEVRAHRDWLGFLQPVGLVVTPPALVAAQAVLPRGAGTLIPLQQRLIECVEATPEGARLSDFPRFAREILDWRETDLHGGPGAPLLPDELCAPLPAYGETLRPTYAVPVDSKAETPTWVILVQCLREGVALDADHAGESDGWTASPQARFERLLRDTGVEIGLLSNETHLRLVYSPRGESSGHLTWPVQALTEVAGRPLLSALHLLLCADRLFVERTERRLPSLLRESRKYQSEVSTRLAEQVLMSLHELLRGFQAADEASKRSLLAQTAATDPQHIYGGLLTVLMRLVFLLYAEEKGLMPRDPVFVRNYAVGGLFERLRADADRSPDTMDQRYGGWAWLLTLFRLVFEGGGRRDAAVDLKLPPRQGELFNPDAYPFLEGRQLGDIRVVDEGVAEPPRVSDGCLFRVLAGLLVLDGERLSYRTLDVEQIGSVYEAMMGFELCAATGSSVAVRPNHVVVNLEALLGHKPADRDRVLREEAGCELPAKAAAALKAAVTVDDVVAALGQGRRLSPRTPTPIATGALYLQPGEERRRSGSHYTPRALTEPIVSKALEPVLAALGERPTPAQILALKVLDPAMGSGAFLVEACRQLGAALEAAWLSHGGTPVIPPDEDTRLHAMRLVALQCLYGVDKNPYAVNLAKLSLWLVTLAREHAFTFLDHCLRHGDSLVGLTAAQVSNFVLPGKALAGGLFKSDATALTVAAAARAKIHATGDDGDWNKRDAFEEAERALEGPRRKGDLCIAAFFAKDKDKAREAERAALREKWKYAWESPPESVVQRDAVRAELEAVVARLRSGARPVLPFHWEVEFPEVFGRDNPGFDVVVGNPPFAGKNNLIAGSRDGYIDWLKSLHAESHGNADLVAHFFRRAFSVLRHGGTLGLIATNTIAQGDTRSSGLRWICLHGGTVYAAMRRLKWPGLAAVVVSVAWIGKGEVAGPFVLDEREVPMITAYLFHAGGHVDPECLSGNAGGSYVGSYLLGLGFTFDDTNPDATPVAEMQRIINADPRNAERIFPYIGGEEVNTSPTHAHHRYVINFGDVQEEVAREWPDLMAIVETKVKPQREKDNRDVRKRYWWRFGETTPALFRAIAGRERVLVTAQTSKYRSYVFLAPRQVFDQKLIVFPTARVSQFTVMSSRPHETWASFFGSTLEDRSVYTPSDCFETFPFPPDWETNPTLEAIGQTYYDFRAALMVRNNQGLTATYNRFHDPDERDPDILRLRELHAEMDRAVLDAYGFTDIPTDCIFRLDYEEPEDSVGDEEAPAKRRKKKPWRLRWPEEVHDEVLARLLELNRQRAEAERLAGLSNRNR